MTPTERADLNRRAAELAGWRFEVAHGETFIFPPDADGWSPWGILPSLPDFCGSPALWWPLVERFAKRIGEDYPRQWHGPTYRADRGGIWEVCVTTPDGWHRRYEASTPGEAVCRAALAVAAALGLG